jgi:predicted RNA-binding protein YlxR (DUF448 family)
MRSCVGCGERAAQAALLASSWQGGQLGADRARRAGGRGHTCTSARLFDAFVVRRGSVRSLRAAVPRAAREQLVRALAARGEE